MRKQKEENTKTEEGLLSPEVQRLVEEFQLESIVSHLLRRAHFMAEDKFNSEFADESITPRQKAALVIIAKDPGLTQNALANRLVMDRNTVAALVKRLCASGMIRRIRANDDQRAYQLFLNKSGAELLDRVLPRDLLVEKKLLEGLPEEYRPLFIKCLKILIDSHS